MNNIFYQPDISVSADYIPYYENGTFYLFYLRDYRNIGQYGEGTPWFLITTTDFVHFEEHGEVLPRGSQEDQDLFVFTGSVTKIGTQYHIYYTGHNPHLRKKGLPEQAVMHAVSDDLLHWEKRPKDTFFAPTGYGIHDWRDPFLLFDPKLQQWRMLLAARTEEGPSRRRGITAQCFSEDGLSWSVGAPFYTPGEYYTHECPDVFCIGDWYYLLFSEFSQEHVTRYRMSRSLEGPWLTPSDDRFDTCAFYAAKTVACEHSRYLLGWIATREGDSDDGLWQWGGCLAVHQLVQRTDGTLAVTIPTHVSDAFSKTREHNAYLDGRYQLATENWGQLPACCKLVCAFRLSTNSGKVSLALAADKGISEGYFITLDFDRMHMYLDRWPRIVENGLEPGLVRPFKRTDDGCYELQLLIDGTAACAYLNNEVALSFRMYDQSKHCWGILATNTALWASGSLCERSNR